MLCELLTKAASLIEVLAYVCNLFLSEPHVALTPRSQPIKNLFFIHSGVSSKKLSGAYPNMQRVKGGVCITHPNVNT